MWGIWRKADTSDPGMQSIAVLCINAEKENFADR